MEEVDLEAVAAVADGRAIMSPGVLRHRAAMGLERFLTKKMGFEMIVLRRRRGSRSRSRCGNFLRSLDQHQHPVGRHLPLEDTDILDGVDDRRYHIRYDTPLEYTTSCGYEQHVGYHGQNQRSKAIIGHFYQLQFSEASFTEALAANRSHSYLLITVEDSWGSLMGMMI